MSEFVSYPKQDSFETTLQSDIDAVVDTIGVNLPPDFALATGSCYAVIDYDKPNTKIEIINFTGISGNNLTGCTRGIAKYEGGATTAQTHASGAKVIISDNWQTWKDIATAIASKFNSAGGTITGNVTLNGNLTQTGNQTVTGDIDITGALTVTTPLAVNQGGTGANNDADARTNLNAAESGANSDITSLSGLTTPLDVPQGGTGAATHTAKSLLVGNGASPLAGLAPGTASQVVISNGTDWVAGDVPPMGVAKKLLSNINTTDGNDDDVARGALVVGNSTPKWSALSIGPSGTVLSSDGVDASWATPPGLIPTFINIGAGITTAFPGDLTTAMNGYYDATNACFYGQVFGGNTIQKYPVQMGKYFGESVSAFNNARLDSFANLYKEAGTWYWLDYSADAAAGWDRYTLSGTRSAMTMAGTSQTTKTAGRTYDLATGLVYVLDGLGSTTIRLWTISGTTISNHTTASITLSQAPAGNDYNNLHISGQYLYIISYESSGTTGIFIDKYYKTTGDWISTTKMTGASYGAYCQIVEDYEHNTFYIAMTSPVGSQPAPVAYIPFTMP